MGKRQRRIDASLLTSSTAAEEAEELSRLYQLWKEGAKVDDLIAQMEATFEPGGEKE